MFNTSNPEEDFMKAFFLFLILSMFVSKAFAQHCGEGPGNPLCKSMEFFCSGPDVKSKFTLSFSKDSFHSISFPYTKGIRAILLVQGVDCHMSPNSNENKNEYTGAGDDKCWNFGKVVIDHPKLAQPYAMFASDEVLSGRKGLITVTYNTYYSDDPNTHPGHISYTLKATCTPLL